MAAWGPSGAWSQWRKGKSSAAVAPKVCTCWRVPVDPGPRTQAATVCLCTSSPLARSISRFMVPPPRVVSPVPGGASFARLCSACSMATMRGADSSHVRLFADSRYQLQSTFPGIRRAVSIDDFHDARVCPRLMAIIFGLGLTHRRRAGARSGVRRVLEVPDAAGEVQDHLLGELGDLPQELPEMSAADDEHAQVGLGLHGGRAWRAIEQAHLAEELTGRQPVPLLHRERHQRRPVDDDEELVAGLALSSEDGPLGHLDDLRDIGDGAELAHAARLEDGDPLEELDLFLAGGPESLEDLTDQFHQAFVSFVA